jgi:hypothetical protein
VPLDDVVLTVTPEQAAEVQRSLEKRLSLQSSAPRPQPSRELNQNSEVMSGTILAQFIFPESDGSVEGQTHNWSEDDMREARIGCAGAFLSWQAWTQMDISTTFNLLEAVPCAYEPILHDMDSDHLWIMDTLRELGYGQLSGNVLESTHELNEASRAIYRTRWVVTSFIANARNVSNHRFGNGNAGYTAYASLGGPYMVEPFPAGTDPNNIGETLVFSKIVQHEVGHCFWTLDEYPGAPGVCSSRSGYLDYANGNITVVAPGGAQLRCEDHVPCIMHSATRVGHDRPWCRYSLGQLGVIDDNDNGYPDIFEAAPAIEFEPAGIETVTTNSYTLRFRAVSRAVPNRNPNQAPDKRVDFAARLQQVTFSLGASTGSNLTPIDGRMDGVTEMFEVPMSLPTAGAVTFTIRARNAVGYPPNPAPFIKTIYFVGVSFSRMAASAKTNRIQVSWETAGDPFSANYDVYRLRAGESMPGELIAQGIGPSGPGDHGFTPYIFNDFDVEPGADYRYYVDANFSLPFEGGTQDYHSLSPVVAQTSIIPIAEDQVVSGITPNPSNGNVTLSFRVPRTYGGDPRTPQRLATPVEVTVYDVRGRRVRVLREQPALEDFVTLRWNGHDTSERPVSSAKWSVCCRALCVYRMATASWIRTRGSRCASRPNARPSGAAISCSCSAGSGPAQRSNPHTPRCAD